MTFCDFASNASFWRGVDYFENGRVIDFETLGESVAAGVVSGSDNQEYDVRIDRAHPRSSSCNCKFAEGRNVICKHMIALYFASTPGAYEGFEIDLERQKAQLELREKQWREEARKSIDKQVASLSAKEARSRLADILYEEALEDRYRKRAGYDYW